MEGFINQLNPIIEEEKPGEKVMEYFDVMEKLPHVSEIRALEDFLKNERLIHLVMGDEAIRDYFIDEIRNSLDQISTDAKEIAKGMIKGGNENIDTDLFVIDKYFYHLKNISMILQRMLGEKKFNKIPLINPKKNYRRLDEVLSCFLITLLEKLTASDSIKLECNDESRVIKDKINKLLSRIESLFPEKLRWDLLIEGVDSDDLNREEERWKSVFLNCMENKKTSYFLSSEEIFSRIVYFLNTKEFSSLKEVSEFVNYQIQSNPEVKEKYIHKYFFEPIFEHSYGLTMDTEFKDIVKFLTPEYILSHKDLAAALLGGIRSQFKSMKYAIQPNSENDPLGSLVGICDQMRSEVFGDRTKNVLINELNDLDEETIRDIDFVLKKSKLDRSTKLEMFDVSFFIDFINKKQLKYAKEDFMYFLTNFTNNSQNIKDLELIFSDCLLDEDILEILKNDFINQEETPKGLLLLLKKHDALDLLDILDRYKNVLENQELYKGFTAKQLFEIVEEGLEKELEKILKKKNNEKELLEFRFNNVFKYQHLEIFCKFRDYLDGRFEEYKIFIDNWKKNYLEENSDKNDSDFYSYISKLNYVKPEKFDSLDILYKYLPKNKSFDSEYHIPLEKISNLDLLGKFQIQDLYQLLAVLIPNSSPNDFGKDKYEIFGTLLSGYLSEDFLQNVVQNELTDEEKNDPSYVVNIVNLKNGKSSEIVSEIFHKRGYYKDFLTLFKVVRVYSSFTKDHHKLQELKERDPKIYQYFEDLLTHESASIDGLKSLLTNPRDFFSKKSSYTNEGLHGYLNPNNWCNISDYRLGVSIDLNQEDIRDINLSGGLDSRAYLNVDGVSVERRAILTTSKKVELIERSKVNLDLLKNNFKEYLSNNFNKDIIEKVISIIFVNYDNIKQDINLNFDINNKFLLGRLKRLIEDKTLILNDKYKNIFDNLDNLSCLDLYKKIIELLNEEDLDHIKQEEIDKLQDFSNIGSNLNIVGKFLKFDDYRRSTVGNDTGSCDSFADGKRTLYNFNPSCFQFSISFEEQDVGKTRRNVIFQSLVTIDYDLKDREILNKIIEGINNGELSEKLGKDFLERFYANVRPVICFDNIEGNKSFKDKIVLEDSNIGEIYIKAFMELARQNPQINQKYFIVGKTYLNDSSVGKWLNGISDVYNTFIPSTLLSYVDNSGQESYIISVDNDSDEANLSLRQNGVFSIDYLDSIPCMYLEDEIHKDNEKEGGVSMQNTLIGSHYSFIKNNIDSLNVGYFDANGVLRGYAIAYPVVSSITEEKSIYIHDLAIEEEYRDKAGSLIISFMQNIADQSRKILEQTSQERIEIKAHTNDFSSRLLEHKDLAKRFGIIIEEESIYIYR